jgi:hypothetical protein
MALAQSKPPFLNAAGDYVIQWTVNGVAHELVFERATHIQPELRVRISRDDQTGEYVYQYSVANGVGARQRIHSVTITDARESVVAPGPNGWTGESVPERARVYWIRLTATGKDGIRPGETARGFVIRSPILPGPTTAELRGATEVPRVAPVVPETALRQLRTLLERDYVTATTIGPSIPGFRTAEPELTLAVFLARIKNRFTVPLIRSGHPGAEELLRGLDAAIAAAKNRVFPEEQIKALEELARRPHGEPLVQELNTALLLNLEHARTQRNAERGNG